jgi:DNA-binding NtrC family response regulator
VISWRKHFRLIGVVNGVPRIFPLRQGVHVAGSIDTDEIVLPTRGVSRRHARFSVKGDTLLVEDLGSKNGTFVNGNRTGRRLLRMGDEVCLGPVVLQVERAGRQESRLALANADMDKEPAPTATIPAWRVVDHNLSMTIERLAELLAGAPGPEALSCALSIVAECLGSRGGLFVLGGRHGMSVVAAAGVLPDDMPAAVESLLAAGTRHGCRIESVEAGQEEWLFATEEVSPGLVMAAIFPSVEYAHDRDTMLRLLLRIGRVVAVGMTTAGKDSARGDSGIRFDDLICSSPGMRAVYAAAASVARSDVSVLLLGETGVGKEHVSRLIHTWSRRAEEPFVPLNCAALPAELVESELFGIEPGVATGVGGRPGLFRRAGKGTILLDEIGELQPSLQCKLLRVLEEQVVRTLGGTAHRLDARIIAATNSRIGQSVADGRFRPDLYYRIAGFTIPIPALRERCEDIAPLVSHFLSMISKEEGKRVRGVTLEALQALRRYEWPGNVRELANEIRRAVLLCAEGEAIHSYHLDAATQEKGAARGPQTSGGSRLATALAEVERGLIIEALDRVSGNRSAAARDLGMSRNGLAARIHRLRITLPHRSRGEG